MNSHSAVEKQPEHSLDTPPVRDALYVFACYLAWRNERSLCAFQELLSALDDPSEEVRVVAESLLSRAAQYLLETAADRHALR